MRVLLQISFMKKIGSLSIFLYWVLCTNVIHAQNAEVERSVTSIFKLNFFLPGISYEQKIAQYQTIHLTSYIDIISNTQSTNAGTSTNFYLTPSIAFEIRNYYNLNKRERMGKRTEMNSGNYLAPVYIGKYSFRNDFGENVWFNQVGAVWGLQRTAPSGFSFDLNLGLGYLWSEPFSGYSNTVDIILQLALGFRI